MIDRELVNAFEEYISLLSDLKHKKDLADAGLTPDMARRLIKALQPYAVDPPKKSQDLPKDPPYFQDCSNH